MPKRDIVVIGGSAWALDPLKTIIAGLPADLPAAVFVVVHIPTDFSSALPEILEAAGKLPAKHPVDGEKIAAGHIYVAPPNRHLTLRQGHIEVKKGARENRHRPDVSHGGTRLWSQSDCGGIERTIGRWLRWIDGSADARRSRNRARSAGRQSLPDAECGD